MKRLSGTILVIVFVFSMGGVAAAQSVSGFFTDIPEGAWYAPYIDICYESGLIEGVGNNRFNPDGTMSIAEMLTVCARLHHVMGGGDGNIPQLPPEGPRGLIYFTDAENNKVASFDDLVGWSDQAGDFIVFFEDEVIERLRGSENPLDTIILVALIYGGTQFYGTYTIDRNGRPGYLIDIPKNQDVGAYLFEDMIGINLSADEYKGEWYESVIWYMGNIIWYGLSEEKETAIDEMIEIIENDFPDMVLYDFSDVEADCPRAMLALFLAVCIPEEYLTQINDIEAIPDFDTELVRMLYNAGILGGVDEYGTFSGRGTLTRAQMAAVIARVLKPELRLNHQT